MLSNVSSFRQRHRRQLTAATATTSATTTKTAAAAMTRTVSAAIPATGVMGAQADSFDSPLAQPRSPPLSPTSPHQLQQRLRLRHRSSRSSDSSRKVRGTHIGNYRRCCETVRRWWLIYRFECQVPRYTAIAVARASSSSVDESGITGLFVSSLRSFVMVTIVVV